VRAGRNQGAQARHTGSREVEGLEAECGVGQVAPGVSVTRRLRAVYPDRLKALYPPRLKALYPFWLKALYPLWPKALYPFWLKALYPLWPEALYPPRLKALDQLVRHQVHSSLLVPVRRQYTLVRVQAAWKVCATAVAGSSFCRESPMREVGRRIAPEVDQNEAVVPTLGLHGCGGNHRHVAPVLAGPEDLAGR
jgi:hypothetical protein